MFNLEKFIADSVTFRPSSMFKGDIEANAEKLTQEIKGKSSSSRRVFAVGFGVAKKWHGLEYY